MLYFILHENFDALQLFLLPQLVNNISVFHFSRRLFYMVTVVTYFNNGSSPHQKRRLCIYDITLCPRHISDLRVSAESVYWTKRNDYRGKVQTLPEVCTSASTREVSSGRTQHQHGSLHRFQWHLNNIRNTMILLVLGRNCSTCKPLHVSMYVLLFTMAYESNVFFWRGEGKLIRYDMIYLTAIGMTPGGIGLTLGGLG